MPSLARAVDEVLGDAAAGEGDDALRQEVEEFPRCGGRVRPDRGGSPVRLADDLVDAVALGPARRDLLDAGSAAVHEDDVGILGAGLVEPLDDRCRVRDVLCRRRSR